MKNQDESTTNTNSQENKPEEASTSRKPSLGLKAKQNLSSAADRWLAKNRSLVLRQTPIWAQSLAGIGISLGGIVILSGILFRIDEVVTVQGQLESIVGLTEVKTPGGGKVSKIFFKDGELVKKGELLLQFDTRQALIDKETNEDLIELERKDLSGKLSILSARQNVLAQKLNTRQEITSSLRELVENGAFQRVEYLQQLDQLYELKNEITSVQLDMKRTQLASEKAIGQYQNNLNQAELILQYQSVYAPVDGVVFDPKAYVSGVLQSGETILKLVPQKGLKAKVIVANKDIGFVKTGQEAKVRVDAFPFTRYGELIGKVTRIGADALPPDQKVPIYRYPVILSLDKSYLESRGTKIPLRSGMAISANIKLRDKRLISLVSDMLVDQTETVKSIRQQ